MLTFFSKYPNITTGQKNRIPDQFDLFFVVNGRINSKALQMILQVLEERAVLINSFICSFFCLYLEHRNRKQIIVTIFLRSQYHLLSIDSVTLFKA